VTRLPRVMVDIETLGLTRDAAIISLGAVRFDAGKLGTTFHRQISLASNNRHDRHIDEDTWNWWTEDRGAEESFLRDGDTLEAVLSDFAEWYGEAAEVWANAPSFDCEALEHAYDQIDSPEPWDFYEERCYRTLSALPVAPELEMQGEEHNALDDAFHQARVAKITLQRLEGGEF
jgi:hypothetical protein